MSQQDDLFKKWQSWLDEINNQWADVLWHQQVLLDLRHMIEANPPLKRPNAFKDWLLDGYIAYQLMALRRQIDHDPKCISIRSLLTQIERNPEVLTRERFTSVYGGDAPTLGSRDFEKLAGKGADRFPPERAAALRDELLSKSKAFQDWIDRRIAHHDHRTPTHEPPTLGALEDVLRFTGKLIEDLNLLVRQVGYVAEPTGGDDWHDILAEPWILPDMSSGAS